MKSNYLVLEKNMVENACVLSELIGVEDEWQLNRGIPRSKDFPQNAVFQMDPELPYDTILQDSLFNLDGLVVGSRRLKDFIEKAEPKSIEYLPVKIRNHKKKIVSKDYFIIHPLIEVDCIDVNKSKARYSEIAEKELDQVKQLVIDEEKIPPQLTMFLLKNFYTPILVRRDFTALITKEGFTGIRWVELSDYPEA